MISTVVPAVYAAKPPVIRWLDEASRASGKTPRTIRIQGIAYGLLTDTAPGSCKISEDAKLAMVELSRNPHDEDALRRYRTDPSIRVPAQRFASEFALQGTPIMDEHNHDRQVGVIKYNRVDGDKLIIDAELNHPDAIRAVLDGNYTGLSIGYKPNLMGDGSIVHTVREVSVCSEPYFKDCLLTEIQATAQKHQRAAAVDAEAVVHSDVDEQGGDAIPHFARIEVVPSDDDSDNANTNTGLEDKEQREGTSTPASHLKVLVDAINDKVSEFHAASTVLDVKTEQDEAEAEAEVDAEHAVTRMTTTNTTEDDGAGQKEEDSKVWVLYYLDITRGCIVPPVIAFTYLFLAITLRSYLHTVSTLLPR